MNSLARPITLGSETERPVGDSTTPLPGVDSLVPMHEHIAREASDLQEFLSRHELLDRYFESLGGYLGAQQIHHESFRIILNQLKAMLPKIPELGKRLWETTNLGQPFLVPLGIKSFGRTVNPERWSGYLSSWRRELLSKSEFFVGITNVARREQGFVAYLEDLGREVEKIQSLSAANSSDKTGILLRVNFYRNLRSDRKAIAAAAFFLVKMFEDNHFMEMLRGDADLILNTMHQLRQDTENTVPGLAAHGFLTQFVRDLVPEHTELLADQELFPIARRTSRAGKEVPVNSANSIVYRFRPATRRIHGIWKGITIGDCVGGDPRWGAENATPERWGTIAIAESQLHYIERLIGPSMNPQRFQFEGYVHIVPVKHKKDGATFGSVEFMSPVMTKRALLKDAGNGVHVVTTFDLWLARYSKLKPASWQGLVIGKSNAFNHDGILDHIRRKPHYLLGNRFEAKEFDHVENLPREIVAHSSRRGSARHFGGNMIFDAMVPDARQLTALREDVVDMYSPMQIYETYLRLLSYADLSVSWWAALSLLRAQDPGHFSLTLALDRFPVALYRGLARLYGPAVAFIQRKYFEWRNLPPRIAPTSELWTETAVELGQWCHRQLDGNFQSVGPQTNISRSERERLTRRVMDLLLTAVGTGRTMAIRGAAAIALGRLKLKDSRILRTLCHAARPRITYRRRIRDGRLQLDALFALVELGWDHPKVGETIAAILRKNVRDMEPAKLLALDVVQKTRASNPKLISALVYVLEFGSQAVREKTYRVCRDTKLIPMLDLERTMLRGQLRDATAPPFLRVDAAQRFPPLIDHEDDADVEFLENRLEQENEQTAREALIRVLTVLGVPNVWTFLNVSRQSIEARSIFLRAMGNRKVASSRVARAIEQAETLEPGFAQRDFALEVHTRFLAGARLSARFSPRAFFRSFTQETVFAVVLIAFLGFETVTSVALLYRSHSRLNQESIYVKEAINEMNDLEEYFIDRRYSELEAALPSFIRSNDPAAYASPKEYEWATELKGAIAELRTNPRKRQEETEKRARRLMQRIELEYHRKLHVGRADETRNTLIYTSLNLFATFIGFLFAAFSTRTLRSAVRKRLVAERTIRESEERFRYCIAGIKDHAIFSLTEDGVITTWNEAAESMTGYSGIDVTGQNISLLLSTHGVRPGAVAHELRQCQKVGWYTGDNSVVRKGGGRFTAHLTLTALRNEKGSTRGIVVVIRRQTKASAA